MVVLSDCFGELDAVVGGLDHLRYKNHEVIIFHIMDPWERDLSVDGHIRCRDLESGEMLTTQAEGVSRGVSGRGEHLVRALENASAATMRDRPHRTRRPKKGPDQALLDYLVKRAKTF